MSASKHLSNRHGFMLRCVAFVLLLPAATFAEMMSHQCGLAALAQPASIWDHDAVVRAVERQLPAWSPGHGIGYHPRTFGFLLDECVRRLTGMPLGQWWRRELAEPMGWDFWIGLPESQWLRVAQLVPGRAEKDHADQAFYRDYMSEGTMTRRAFLSPSGLHAVQDMNTPQAWSAGMRMPASWTPPACRPWS
jgi:CubicO group peptidase (beta-lactamase class C family)